MVMARSSSVAKAVSGAWVLMCMLRVCRASPEYMQPVPLGNVRLKEGSQHYRAAKLNAEYMMSLAHDDMMYTFRQNAGLPTSGRPYNSSWEDPTCEVRGQFMGHYLSAGATLSQNTGVRHKSPS